MDEGFEGGEPAVVQFVDRVLGQAVRERASDIHFEPFESEFKIRYRIDGALVEMPSPPARLARPVTSRLKILSNLDIAERRLPQDGRLTLPCDGRSVDFRVSTLPTQFGESVVLRVLDPTVVHLDLDRLGMPPRVFDGIRAVLARPNGMLLVTGPTGSGKTTTLYSALRSLNRPNLKLLTVEDPVEYEMDGIMQVALNPAAGLDFSSALRSFLRQDPDVIMVGEIRDSETARISVQAALTGHQVFSTLHTNDAVGAITRLVDLGVEPYLIASSVEGVLAQRLLRRVCPHCKTACRPAEPERAKLQGDHLDGDPENYFLGVGCSACGETGFHGRVGIFEWLPVTVEIRDLAAANAPALEIRRQAVKQGMRSLRDEAVRALNEGVTTIEEVLRAT